MTVAYMVFSHEWAFSTVFSSAPSALRQFGLQENRPQFSLYRIRMLYYYLPWGRSSPGVATVARSLNFRPNTQKRAQKMSLTGKKLEAVKLKNFDKSGRKETGKYFYNYLEEKPYSLYVLRFPLGVSKKHSVILNFFCFHCTKGA
jgi:hypothetical protein